MGCLRFAIVGAAAFFTMPIAALAEGPAAVKPLQIDEIVAAEPLTGRLPSRPTWSPDGTRFLYTLPGGKVEPLDTHVYDVRTKTDRVFFKASALGKGARPVAEIVWSPDSRVLAYLDGGDLFTIAADGSGKRRLAKAVDDPQWSPSGDRIGFVHDGGIAVVNVKSGLQRQLTHAPRATEVDGDPDWVYSEELAMDHAFRWSPAGDRIAYLHFDDAPVTSFPIVDFLKPDQNVERERYPLAGEKNPIVTLRSISASGGTPRTYYTTKTHDDYVPTIGFMPDGTLIAELLDRAQQHMRFVAFTGARPKTIAREDATTWVEARGRPEFSRDGATLYRLSEASGEQALTRTDVRTGRNTTLTHGYHVSSIERIDREVAYVSAAYPTRRDTSLLAISLVDGTMRAVASSVGRHKTSVAPSGTAYLDTFSTMNSPPDIAIGDLARTNSSIPFMQSKSLAARALPEQVALSVDSSLGTLDAWMIKPPDFDPQKKYPVIVSIYGGPAAPTTANGWGGSDALFNRALAQRGFIVFSIDGPGSQIDKAAAVRSMFHALGPRSLAGQLAGARYLAALPFVDPARLGITGWSFGGYETTYVMSHAPGVFKAGEAGGTVADWSLYDTIYTERYMGTPQKNAAAYRESSVLEKASNLKGKLLMQHGTSDDNVHMANTIELIQAFVKAGIQVDLDLYPRKRHGVTGIPERRHLLARQMEFWMQNL